MNSSSPRKGAESSGSEETLYDRLQRRLKNHPLGIAVLVLLALAGFVGFNNIKGWVTRGSAPPATAPPASPCIYVMFDSIPGTPAAKTYAEVDGSVFSSMNGRLGDIVAVVTDFRADETLTVSVSTFSDAAHERPDSRAAGSLVVNAKDRFYLARRVPSPVASDTYDLRLEGVSEESYRRFLSRADFNASPICRAASGVLWWEPSRTR